MDLFQSFIIAIFFVILFKLQRELFSHVYFAASDIVFGFESAPTKKAVLIRLFILLAYGNVLCILIDSHNNIILGMTFGSFLIVWPVFLNEENIDNRVFDKRILLKSMLVLFVFITYLATKLSIISHNIGTELLNFYLQDFDLKRLVNLIGDAFLWTIFLTIFGYLSSFIKRKLNERISMPPLDSRNDEYPSDPTAEVAASTDGDYSEEGKSNA
jgi:hypothetical protein